VHINNKYWQFCGSLKYATCQRIYYYVKNKRVRAILTVKFQRSSLHESHEGNARHMRGEKNRFCKPFKEPRDRFFFLSSIFFFFLQLWTPNMTQYSFFENSIN
jgi:hypothetical protein